MASGAVFAKMLGVGMTKTAKIIVTAPKRRLWREAGVVCGLGTKLPPSRVIEGPSSRSKTGGSLHAALRPSRKVRDDDENRVVIGRLAMLVQGLRSHPLKEIHRMDFATDSRAGDCFTACPTNQYWVRAIGVPLGR